MHMHSRAKRIQYTIELLNVLQNMNTYISIWITSRPDRVSMRHYSAC